MDISYLVLKLKAIFLRNSIWFTVGSPRTSPDDILQIPSRDAGRTIKANVYRPQSTKIPGPVVLNFHGSGFVFPMHGGDDEFCRYVASNTDYTVLDVSYRLAPENPFPAALNDVEDAIKYVLDRPHEFDLSHFALSGFSAGANLSLVASSLLFPKETFRSLIAFYPPCDMYKEPEFKIPPDLKGKPLPTFLEHFFLQSYIPAAFSKKDPRMSPTFAPPENFPAELLLITCSGDGLCLEAEEMAERIEAAGKSHVVRRRMEGCDHGWNNKKWAEESPQEKAKNDAYTMSVEMLRL